MDKNKELINQVLDEYENLFIQSPEFREEKTKSELRSDIEDGSSEMVVYGDGPIKGFCIFYKQTYDHYYIDYLGVTEKHQGQGVGKKIMKTVLQLCFENEDVTTISLLCLDCKVPFYEKLGFRCLEKMENTIWNKMINKKCQH